MSHNIIEEIRNELFDMKDTCYKEFHKKLIPNIEPDTIIGVRTPVLRKYAKDIGKRPDINVFLTSLPHKYYEENNLHGFIIDNMKDYDMCINAIESFLPYVDNWATCDSMSPKVLKKKLPNLYDKIVEWVTSEHVYTIRFAVVLLMRFYLDEAFEPYMLDLVTSIRSEEYYVNMGIAWYIATALAKQYDTTIRCITEHKLETWTHNKAIQKAIESYRISDETKQYLKTLKI